MVRVRDIKPTEAKFTTEESNRQSVSDLLEELVSEIKTQNSILEKFVNKFCEYANDDLELDTDDIEDEEDLQE